jgi:hypothetical protein
MKPVLTVLRSRIRVGSSETLAAQAAQCPRCSQKLCLMWPEYVLQIPLHRVVHVHCPACTVPFSLIAIDLISIGESWEDHVAAVVSQVS